MQCRRWAGIDRTNTTLDTYITKYGDHRYISTRGPDYKTKYVYAVKSFTNEILDRGGLLMVKPQKSSFIISEVKFCKF